MSRLTFVICLFESREVKLGTQKREEMCVAQANISMIHVRERFSIRLKLVDFADDIKVNASCISTTAPLSATIVINLIF